MKDQSNLVRFGAKAFCITSAEWNSTQQHGIIRFEDDNGIQFETISLGMLPNEQRAAVFDADKNAWIDSKAADISDTAEQLDATLKALAVACGNHPYEDGS